jgi:hypothetical protein
MDQLYDCPDCHRLHDEPAEAILALRVRCLDCELEIRFAAPAEPELGVAA